MDPDNACREGPTVESRVAAPTADTPKQQSEGMESEIHGASGTPQLAPAPKMVLSGIMLCSLGKIAGLGVLKPAPPNQHYFQAN